MKRAPARLQYSFVNWMSKKRRLFERKRVEKPPTTVSTTTAPSSTTITTRETSPSAVTTVAVSSTAATQERKETQERIVDSALRAVLGRAVKGEVQEDPLVWAAVGAISDRSVLCSTTSRSPSSVRSNASQSAGGP